MSELTQLIELMKLQAEQSRVDREAEREEAAGRAEADRELIRQLLVRLENGGAHGESASDVKAKNLADSMESFVYDPSSGATFNQWYKRYQTIFTTEVDGWSEPQKMRLLMRKFSQSDYDTFANKCLPQVPSEINLEDAVKSLSDLFGHAETKFSLRYKCFDVRISESESYREYGARINKMGEDFDIVNTSPDDLKTLLFISGLKDPKHGLVLEKLLNKITEQQRKIEAAADDEARTAIVKLKINDLINDAQSIILLKKDKAEVAEAPVMSEINAIKNPGKGRKSRSGTTTKSFRPCRHCGGEHRDFNCEFKGTCDTCSSSGHKAGFCKSSSEANLAQIEWLKKKQTSSRPAATTAVNHIGAVATSRKFTTVKINGKKLRLQLDTGSDITVISYHNWILIGKPPLNAPPTNLASASGHSVKVWGVFDCNMSCNDKTGKGVCYVASRLNLLGNNWMGPLGLWNVPIKTFCNNIVAEDLVHKMKEKFPKLFSAGLGLCTTTQASMTLKTDARKVFMKARSPPFAALQPIEEEIERCVQAGIFSPTEYSDYAAPIVVVKKKNGKIRLCGDYSTGLNDVLEPNQFPLPTADQIFAGLTGCDVFSVIDLSDAFLQIPLDENAKKLLTVNTHKGLFNVTRLQPGVKTAPGIFQEIMTKLLSGTSKTFAFIDDIILGGKGQKEHDEVLLEVLQRIQDHGFKLRDDKCRFGKKSLPFCGHIVSKDGIRPNPEKVQEISEIPRPEDVHQVRSFLGAVNYYGKFVKGMMDLRGPLIELTLNDAKFVWGEKQEDSFLKLKQIMASELVLTHYDPKKKIVVAADASAYGMGGAIMHEFADGTLHPVLHVAKAFSAAQKNYSQIEKEAEALVFTVKRCHKYLFGRRFELHTDHKPLLTIFGSKKGIPVITASRLQRHALTLLAYDFDVKYINTESFGYADMVSRLIAKHEKSDEDTVIAAIHEPDEAEVRCFAIDTAQMLPVNFVDLQKATKDSATLTKVADYVKNGWPQTRRQIRSSEVARFWDQRHSLSIIDGCIFFGERIIVPENFRPKLLEELHSGHPGMVRMKMLARSKVFWPKINTDMERVVKSCDACAKTGKTPIKCTLQPWPAPNGPWSRVHIDYAEYEKNYFLVMVDAFSKYPEVFRTSTTTTAKTIELISSAFTCHGNCDTIVSDNGPQFTSAEFKTFCDSRGIVHIRTAPYSPQSNGQAERFVDLLKTGLKKAEGNIDQKLREFLFHYRSTPAYNLGMKAPFELRWKHENATMKTNLDLVKPQKRLQAVPANSKMAQQFNAHHGAKWKQFKVGDNVNYQLHRSNDSWQWTPAKVLTREGEVNYVIQTEAGRVVKAHANQLKMRFPVDEDALPNTYDDANFYTADIQDDQSVQSEPSIYEDASGGESEVDASGAESEVERAPSPVRDLRRSQRSTRGIPANRYGYD